VAEEVRALLSEMGVKHVSEIVGRSDLMVREEKVSGRAKLVDLAKFLQPDMALSRLGDTYPQIGRGVCRTELNERGSLNQRIIGAAEDAIETCQNADLMFRIRNGDRSVGATVAGLIAKLYGREGMPNFKRVRVRFEGEAGQSFGAWCVNGLDLELRGFAQDGVAKGISGGAVVVTL